MQGENLVCDVMFAFTLIRCTCTGSMWLQINQTQRKQCLSTWHIAGSHLEGSQERRMSHSVIVNMSPWGTSHECLLLMLECGCGLKIWDVQSSCTVRGSHLCLAAEIMELKIKIKNGLVRAKCKEFSRCPTLKANCEISCFVYILSLMYIYLLTLTLRLWVALNTSFLYALTDGDVTGTQDGFLCDWYKNHVVTSHSFYK